MDKLDPVLQVLVEALAAGTLPVDPDDPEFIRHVYVVGATEDFSGLEASGLDVTSPLGTTAIVTLPIASLEDLAARPDIVAVFAPRAGVPRQAPVIAHTTAQALMRLQQAWAVTSTARPNGTKGTDVIVGIVDSGVNILHDAFTRDVVGGGAHVRQTRILSLWQQGNTRRGNGPLWQRNGRLFDSQAINNHIAAFVAAGTMPPARLVDASADGVSHGTAAASVAAGSSWSAGPDALGLRSGVAPDADLIVVAREGSGDLLAGIEFCFETARGLGRPCVVNMSLGTNDLPHNGLSIFSHRLRGLVFDPLIGVHRPGRCFVKPAGNQGGDHNHLALSLTQPVTIQIRVFNPPPTERDRVLIGLTCFISSSQPGLQVSVSPPGTSAFTPPGPFAGPRVVAGQRIRVGAFASIPAQLPLGLRGDTDTHILVDVQKHIALGTTGIHIAHGIWELRLDPGAVPHPDVHLWLDSGGPDDSHRFFDPTMGFGFAQEDDGLGMDPAWRRRKEWIEATLDGDSAAQDAIIVGGSVFSTDFQVEGPWRLSSRGPVTDPLLPAADSKPDLAATANGVVVATFQRAGNSLAQSSISGRLSGTSFAAPAVAGAAALMLSHDPTLNQEEIRTILRSTATGWGPTVRQIAFVNRDINERNIAGAGLINIEDAVKAAAARVP